MTRSFPLGPGRDGTRDHPNVPVLQAFVAITIELPDGSRRQYDGPVTAARVAAEIGAGLAKAALGASINGELSDLTRPIGSDAKLQIVTAKGDSPDPEALWLM